MKLGKRPYEPDDRDLRYADVRPAKVSLPTPPPPSGGYGRDFSDWLMLGNGPCDDGSIDPSWAAYKGAGDCVWAGPGHETMEACKNSGRPIPAFTCLNVLEQYSAYSGYNLQTGANDNGSQIRDVLNWRKSKGLVDASGAVHKIGTYAALEPGNTEQLWEALWLFEAVAIGIQFPASAMDQFNAGEEWTVVKGAQIEGGHYVPLVGHPVENTWTCVTWAKRQTLSQEFLTTYCDEAWVYVDTERYSALTGKSPQGYTAAELEEYIALLAQQKQNGKG
jgi:hypothetical protein